MDTEETLIDDIPVAPPPPPKPKKPRRGEPARASTNPEQRAVCDKLVAFWRKHGHPEVWAEPQLRPIIRNGKTSTATYLEITSNISEHWVPCNIGDSNAVLSAVRRRRGSGEDSA